MIARLLIIVMGACLVVGMAHVGAHYYADTRPDMTLIVAGVMFGILAFFLKPSRQGGLQFDRPASTARHRRRWPTALGLALILGQSFAILLAIVRDSQPDWLITIFDPIWSVMSNNHAQFGMWAGGLTLLVWGLVPGEEWAQIRNSLVSSWQNRRGKWLGLVILTLLAFLIRFVRLENMLPLLWGDEAPFGLYARSFASGEQTIIFAPGYLSHPQLFHYLLSHFVALLGNNFSAIRLLPALVGTLTAPAMVWLGKELFDDLRVGWIGGLFLATYPVHVHFSRLALNNIVDPFFLVLALAALMHGLRHGKRWAFVVAGLSLGLSQYFYAGGRLAPPLFFGFLALLILQQPRKAWAFRMSLAILILTFLLTTLPANTFLLAHNMPFTSRLTTMLFTPDGMTWSGFLETQLIPAFMALIHTRDAYYFYGGQTAMLLPWAAVVFLAGVAYIIRQAVTLRANAWLLIVWIVSTVILGGALLDYVPGYARYVIAFPAITLVVAVGFVRAGELCFGRFSTRWAIVLALPLVIYNGVYYLGTHREILLTEIPYDSWRLHNVGVQAASLQEEAVIHLIFPQHIAIGHWKSVIAYMANPADIVWHPYTVEEPDVQIEAEALAADVAHIFFMPAGRHDVLAALMDQFPQGEFHPTASRYAFVEPQVAFYLPAQERTDGP